jgi:predicted dehydrogenase
MRIGFIGGNNLAIDFFNDFVKNNSVTEMHLLEQDIARSRNMIKLCPEIKYHVETKAFIDSIDSIIVCALHKKNNELVLEAAKRGKNLIITNPYLLAAGSIRKLQQLESEAGITIQIGGTEKYNAAFLASKNYIKDPVFVDVARLTHYSPSNQGISVLYDLLYKDLDWVLNIINSNIRKISANSVSVTGNEIDFINSKLEFDNGCIANLTASRVSELNLNKARIYNSDSILFVDLLNNQIKRSFKKSNHLEFEDLDFDRNTDRLTQFNNFYFSTKGEEEIQSTITGFLKTKDVLELIFDKIKAKTTPFVK